MITQNQFHPDVANITKTFYTGSRMYQPGPAVWDSSYSSVGCQLELQHSLGSEDLLLRLVARWLGSWCCFLAGGLSSSPHGPLLRVLACPQGVVTGFFLSSSDQGRSCDPFVT